MTGDIVRTLASVFLILGGLGLIVPFEMLRRSFEYPDILRKPTGEVLKKYLATGSRLPVLWLVFALAAVLFVPATVFLHQLIATKGVDVPYLSLATVFGLLAALFNLLGLMRWVFLVPQLARSYADPASDPARRAAIEVVFEGFHTYFGVTVGEFLGYSAMSIWGILVAFAMMQAGLLGAIFAVPGIVFSVGVLLGTLEFAGWKPAGAIVAISSALWAVWLIVVGVALMFV